MFEFETKQIIKTDTIYEVITVAQIADIRAGSSGWMHVNAEPYSKEFIDIYDAMAYYENQKSITSGQVHSVKLIKKQVLEYWPIR